MGAQESFGQRLRRLRRERGWSQEDLAADVMSPSYVSLLEAGKRNPTPAAVERLAERLGCDPGLLSSGVTGSETAEMELELRYAQLVLHSGDAGEALRRFGMLLEQDPVRTTATVRAEARWGRARALEAIGRVEEAIACFEEIREEAESAERHTAWLPTVVALCHCYLEVGDLSRSVELGEQARLRLAELGLAGSDQEVELLATLVGAYQSRGDRVRARMLVQETVALADSLGTRRARGAAYWNASLISQGLGRSVEALGLAERALALYAESDDAHTMGRLRTAYAWILLHQRPPRPEEAEALLTTALRDLTDIGSEIDIAYCETELARVRLLLGRPDEALELATSSLSRLGPGQRIETPRARLLQGQARMANGDASGALAAYRAAAEELSAIGASREAAAGWRELAEALSQLGRDSEALDAYRRATDVLGLIIPALPAALLHR